MVRCIYTRFNSK